jgi:hypothetical protein
MKRVSPKRVGEEIRDRAAYPTFDLRVQPQNERGSVGRIQSGAYNGPSSRVFPKHLVLIGHPPARLAIGDRAAQ